MKLFTVTEASDILGVKPKTLRDWIWKKRIETVRKGSRYVRISDAAIQNFVEEHTVPSATARIGKRKPSPARSAEVLEAHGS